MNYIASVLYLLSGTFVWFYLGDLAFKVDPKDAIVVFVLLLVNHITKRIILAGEKK